MLQVQYAAANSKGVLAPLIGWIDFGTLVSLTQSSPSTHISNAISGGYLICFDISLSLQGNPVATSQVKFAGTTVPTSPEAPFGTTSYTGIPGHVALSMPTCPPHSNEVIVTIVLRNISVTDIFGNPIDDYFIVAADSGVTTQCTSARPETWSVSTDGSTWELVEELPSSNGYPSGSPTVSGVGTRTVTETGSPTSLENISANAFLTESPTELIARGTLDGSRQSFSFGIIIPEPKDCYPLATVRASHINYVDPPHCTFATLPLKPSEELISVIYNNKSFPLHGSPVLINGQLGTYVFFDTYVLFSGTWGGFKNNFDIFSLNIQKCNDCILKFIVFTSKPHSECC